MHGLENLVNKTVKGRKLTYFVLLNSVQTLANQKGL
jgi:hypothetical protein